MLAAPAQHINIIIYSILNILTLQTREASSIAIDDFSSQYLKL